MTMASVLDTDHALVPTPSNKNRPWVEGVYPVSDKVKLFFFSTRPQPNASSAKVAYGEALDSVQIFTRQKHGKFSEELNKSISTSIALATSTS